MSTISASTTSTTAYKVTADTTGTLVFQTGATPTTVMTIDGSGYVTNAVNGNGNGLHQAYQYYRLNSAYAGSNATGAQSIFGVGVTLAASTVYEFEYSAILTKTAGTTSHTFSIGLGGTATLNNLIYVGTTANKDSSAMPFTTNTTFVAVASNSASSLSLVSGITSATESIFLMIKGTVSVNASGTFIPQYTLSAAPGGAYSTQIGSYFKISALSASGANTSVGTWA
jgi:hypothetical protein